jgi:hypothetical protein
MRSFEGAVFVIEVDGGFHRRHVHAQSACTILRLCTVPVVHKSVARLSMHLGMSTQGHPPIQELQVYTGGRGGVGRLEEGPRALLEGHQAQIPAAQPRVSSGALFLEAERQSFHV